MNPKESYTALELYKESQILEDYRWVSKEVGVYRQQQELGDNQGSLKLVIAITKDFKFSPVKMRFKTAGSSKLSFATEVAIDSSLIVGGNDLISL